MEKIKIAIVDDHEIVRDGIIAMLEDYEHIYVTGQAKCGEEVLSLCEEKSGEIDLIIMDLNMGEMGGIEATKRVKEQYPGIKILALTMMKDEEKIREMTQAGASGYILKNSGMEELVKAIEQVMKGEIYYSDEAVYSIITGKKEPNKDEPLETDLTARELEVLEYICKEYTNAEIADKLYLSVRTVDAHRRNLLQKTGARNTAGLVRFAMKHNLLGN
ncbi:response regulator transcription factor [Balneolaceae bacterium YR4-1]|uniref:Response regulator transcription factor n=1 Tax=Halalkalibaculum roseum TaxID=2709311 RepID=A0A6M1SK02_9BACT|nr:response regulator transcription factor [Halalkalibaculum roseum]NGP75349.1 response regulator transcription factor [Halalkalibaculum roseum]